MAVRHGCGNRVGELLAEGKFEEAAEEIEEAHHGALAMAIRDAFDPTRLTRPTHTPAVDRIPRLTSRFVLTTNFDTVLETAFERAGKPFEAVYQGTQILQATAAVHDGRHVLLKLHGTYDREAERVLTRSEYETHYRRPDPARQGRLRIPNVLKMALGKQPVLFVGCSLRTDRTMDVLGSRATA